MPRRGNRFYRSRTVGRNSHKEWILEQGYHAISTPGDTSATVIRLYAQELRDEDCTLLRTRGYVNIGGAISLSQAATLVFGQVIVPKKFENSTDVPNPLSDADSDNWHVIEPAGWLKDGSNMYAPIMVDSKAKRRVNADEVCLSVVGFRWGASAAATTLHASVYMKTLIGY